VFAPGFDGEAAVAARFEALDARGAASAIEQQRRGLYAAVLAGHPAPPGGCCLDAGCGAGTFVRLAARHGWRGLGVDPAAIAESGPGFTLRRERFPTAPGERLGEPDGAFHLVTFFNTLNYMSDPLSALREARRLLAPGGSVVVRVPNVAFHLPLLRAGVRLARVSRAGGWVTRGTVLHPRSFSPRALRAVLVRAGFHGVRVSISPTTDGDPYATGVPGVPLLKAAVAGAAVAVAAASRNRLLLAPSLLASGTRPAEAAR
jgi:SAM-dependent methyltransferase